MARQRWRSHRHHALARSQSFADFNDTLKARVRVGQAFCTAGTKGNHVVKEAVLRRAEGRRNRRAATTPRGTEGGDNTEAAAPASLVRAEPPQGKGKSGFDWGKANGREAVSRVLNYFNQDMNPRGIFGKGVKASLNGGNGPSSSSRAWAVTD